MVKPIGSPNKTWMAGIEVSIEIIMIRMAVRLALIRAGAKPISTNPIKVVATDEKSKSISPIIPQTNHPSWYQPENLSVIFHNAAAHEKHLSGHEPAEIPKLCIICYS